MSEPKRNGRERGWAGRIKGEAKTKKNRDGTDRQRTNGEKKMFGSEATRSRNGIILNEAKGLEVSERNGESGSG